MAHDHYEIEAIGLATSSVGSDEYWIETVNGETWVGGGGRHGHHSYRRPGRFREPLFISYALDEYGVPVRVEDDDTDERKGSRVAGFFDEAVSGDIASGKLEIGQSLKPGDRLFSPNRQAYLVLQKDGNLVLYRAPGRPDQAMWNSGTMGRNSARFTMQSDGNAVLYDANGSALWNSGTYGKGGYCLEVQSDGNMVLYNRSHQPLWNTNTYGFAVRSTHTKGIGDVVHALNKAAKDMGSTVNKIPVLGTVIHATLSLNPISVLGGLTAKVLSGERLDRAFLDTAKTSLKAVREIAPFVKTVISFVPGVGTGIAAAIAAGTAIAEGRTLTEAVMDGIIGSVPGGALGQSIARGVVNVAKGESLSAAALDALKKNLPAQAGPAIDAAVKIAGGQNVKAAVLQAVRAELPPDVQRAVDIATAAAAALNIQSSAVKALTQPSAKAPIQAVGAKVIAAMPRLIPHMPNGPAGDGFKLAMGVAAHTAVNAHSLSAMRDTLPPEEKRGFDSGIAVLNDMNNPNWNSLVSNGVVYRGLWRPASQRSDGAVYGRHVGNGKVTPGWYLRA